MQGKSHIHCCATCAVALYFLFACGKCLEWTCLVLCFNPLPNDKFLDQSKFKAFADNKRKFRMGREENIVEKGENAGYQQFLLFTQCFQKDSPSGLLKLRNVW